MAVSYWCDIALMAVFTVAVLIWFVKKRWQKITCLAKAISFS